MRSQIMRFRSLFNQGIKSGLPKDISDRDMSDAVREMLLRLEYRGKTPPLRLIKSLSAITDTTHESAYYGIYGGLLGAFFDQSLDYSILPQQSLPSLPGERRDHTADFVVGHIRGNLTVPVFFLEAKIPDRIKYASQRLAADDQMRDRLLRLGRDTTLPRMHGISVMGKRFAPYNSACADGGVRVITPTIAEGIPANRWSDLTTREGWNEFTSVINDVKEMVELEKCSHHLGTLEEGGSL